MIPISRQLRKADFFKEVKNIPKDSVDLVIIDPPYGKTQNKWDENIDFEKMWNEIERVCKESAAKICFGQDHSSHKVISSNKEQFRYRLIWQKSRPSGFLNASRMPLKNHEEINIFYNSLPTFNPQFTEGEPFNSMGDKFEEEPNKNNNYGDFDKAASKEREGSTEKYPKSVLEFKKPHPPEHPTQKPVELIQWLIRSYSEKGDLVLDPFGGVGTTAVACQRENRDYVLIEKDEEYCRLAKNQVSQKTLTSM